MTHTCSVTSIPARWHRGGPFAVVSLLALLALPGEISPCRAQDAAALVKAYRDGPTRARRAALERFADAHPKDQSGAAAHLALGAVALDQKDYPSAVFHFNAAQARLPKLADYVAYYSASAHVQAQEFPQTLQSLAGMKALAVPSPLGPRAVLLEAKALVETGAPADAVRRLRERYAELPQPDADLALATAYQASQDLPNAALYYQRVYYHYPASDAAAAANTGLAALRESLGAAYPPATSAEMLERGDRWIAAREYAEARREFEKLTGQLAGLERDQALVRVGAADYLARNTSAAYRYLQSLDLERSEADAERWYYITECRRRLNDDDGMLEAVRVLDKQYPQSPWRLKALIAAGNRFVLLNQPDKYTPLFRAAYAGFPTDPQASYCHWKIAFSAHMGRRKDAVELLRGPPRAPADPEPSALTRQRLERARCLQSFGFQDWAETELRYGARHDGQPHVIAMELAKTAKVPYIGMRWMKSLVPDYLATPFDQLPARFWQYLFPLPYQKDLVQNAKLQNLDPYVVAGLIRQESEFNPAAISRKNAYGLTQILPPTGRELARRNGVPKFRTGMLLQPAINLKLGTRYLRGLLDQWGGNWAETLASYNAGKSRVNEWITWDTFREPAEFIETIPFTETREYVQAVLRNAALYKRLYGAAISEVRSTNGPPPQKRRAGTSRPRPLS
ncbi:MAG: transglycosylase SLT domain-containing protein [Candidatus Solibacter usitatus]|nr:transglycosylase SLT domain-containing protein [Candidatus Solibacter usitatus]